MTKSGKMSPSHRQEFCVRWNSHLGSIGAAFPQLLAGQRFVDVTLACEGHQVHCHRLVLAACSSYFESILAENPCKHPVIILPSEIKLWEIQALVDFMYKGEVNVTQAGLPQLLRCAEQLRIRGLYGSDAALNLNQLKALTGKTQTQQQANNIGSTSAQSTGLPVDSNDEDTATNSTTTTTATATSTVQSNPQNIVIKKEPSVGPPTTRPVLTPVSLNSLMANPAAAPNFVTQQQQDSGDESTSNAYEQYENSQNVNNINSAIAAANAPITHLQQQQQQLIQQQQTSNSMSIPQNMSITHHMDSTIEEDHNYVAHDEDDSFSGAMADTEHDSTANNTMLQGSMDQNSSLRRIRRSEESLEQAAKCVSKGQTFQTVSNMYNIPVSTIRFYMARKGILPKRKRGRGASSSGGGGGAAMMALGGSSNNILASAGMGTVIATNPAALAMQAAAASHHMSQALAQIKQRSDSPNSGQFSEEAAYHLMSYKMKTEVPRLV